LASTQKIGGKIRDKLEEEASREAISFYRAWRQKTKNGVLPVGIANVGKTTFLQRFEVDEPNVFLDFNRTLTTHVDKVRLRQDLAQASDGIDFYKKIDVPGDLPDQWAAAYFNNSPRVLVVMVDERDPKIHIEQLRRFLGYLVEGPSVWQRTKAVFALRWDNLSRVLFVVNKVDKVDPKNLSQVVEPYRALLADIQSTLQVPVQSFGVSLSGNDANAAGLFLSVVDGLSRK
jgi:GTP-binding protein EngB required for normal cell division